MTIKFVGFLGGRARDEDDEFENAVERAMGERLRAEGGPRFGDDGEHQESLATRLWGSLTNCDWVHESGDRAGYTFRSAGDLIAAVRGEGDYLDWYCSHPMYDLRDPEVCALLAEEGWQPEAVEDCVAVWRSGHKGNPR